MVHLLAPRYAFDGTRIPDHKSTCAERIQWLELALAAFSFDVENHDKSCCLPDLPPIPAYFWSVHDMQSFRDIWQFTRERLDQAYKDLSEEQLLWRPHAAAHNIGELLYHMAGAEHYWASRMTARDPSDTPWGPKLDQAVREGFLLDGTSSPFSDEDMKLSLIAKALEYSGAALAPILEDPKKEQLEMRLISPLGPEISGYEGFLRIAQHAAYHTGQIWIYRMDPRFPK